MPRRFFTDAELARLQPGQTVSVHRVVPATADRRAHTRTWHVVIASVDRRPGSDGWILTPDGATADHHGDFHIGSSGHGLYTRVGPATVVAEPAGPRSGGHQLVRPAADGAGDPCTSHSYLSESGRAPDAG